jgi:hypothetical protein
LSGRSINRAASSTHNWIYIGGLLFSVWIVSALTFRTTSIKERLLFAFVSVAFVLYAAPAVKQLSQLSVHVSEVDHLANVDQCLDQRSCNPF